MTRDISELNVLVMLRSVALAWSLGKSNSSYDRSSELHQNFGEGGLNLNFCRVSAVFSIPSFSMLHTEKQESLSGTQNDVHSLA